MATLVQVTAPLQYSYSSLSMFDKCPKRFYHQKVAKEVVDKPGVASIHGERAHKAFEDRIGPAKTPLPTEMSKHEKLCQAIEGVAVGATLEVEKELCITQALVPSKWRDKDTWMRSKLDVMGYNGHRGLCIDWKFGKRRPDFLQLKISAAQMFIHYPELELITTAFVWLREEALDMEVYTRDQLPDLLNEIYSKIKRVEASAATGVWPARPSGLCEYCPAKALCEFAQSPRGRR